MTQKSETRLDLGLEQLGKNTQKRLYTAPKLYPNLLEQYTSTKQQFGTYEITIPYFTGGGQLAHINRGPAGS
jgi:hypothetical protein